MSFNFSFSVSGLSPSTVASMLELAARELRQQERSEQQEQPIKAVNTIEYTTEPFASMESLTAPSIEPSSSHGPWELLDGEPCWDRQDCYTCLLSWAKRDQLGLIGLPDGAYVNDSLVIVNKAMWALFSLLQLSPKAVLAMANEGNYPTLKPTGLSNESLATAAAKAGLKVDESTKSSHYQPQLFEALGLKREAKFRNCKSYFCSPLDPTLYARVASKIG